MLRYPSFIQQMINLRDRGATLASKFGVPNVRSLVIITREENEDRYLEIEPHPIINEVRSENQEVEGLKSVTGITKTFEVKGISRKYSREQLEHHAIDYIIDGKVKFGKLISGITCRLISLNEQTTTWEMTLEQRIGESDFY